MDLFRMEIVRKRLGNQSAVRYCCFCDLANGRYAVQSADSFAMPIDAMQLTASERQLVELFIEESVLERCAWFASIEEVIRAHDLEFGNSSVHEVGSEHARRR